MSATSAVNLSDLVGSWDVPLSDGVHVVEFEHGTTSGRRVVRVDGKEVVKKEWMFKLVGGEEFDICGHPCAIKIAPIGSFSYQYTLSVDGKSYKKFTERQSKVLQTWIVPLAGHMYRVVLEKDTLDVWVNGQRQETAGEFVDDGTETHFQIDGHAAYIKNVSSGKRREGILHTLIVDQTEVPEAAEY